MRLWFTKKNKLSTFLAKRSLIAAATAGMVVSNPTAKKRHVFFLVLHGVLYGINR